MCNHKQILCSLWLISIHVKNIFYINRELQSIKNYTVLIFLGAASHHSLLAIHHSPPILKNNKHDREPKQRLHTRRQRHRCFRWPCSAFPCRTMLLKLSLSLSHSENSKCSLSSHGPALYLLYGSNSDLWVRDTAPCFRRGLKSGGRLTSSQVQKINI